MELHAPGAIAKAKRLTRLLRTPGKADRTRRQSKDGLLMHHMGGKHLRHVLEQRIGLPDFQLMHHNGSQLPPVSPVSHNAAKRMGKQLVPKADAKHRNPGLHAAEQPFAELLAPRCPVADHGMRPCHHHAGNRGRLWQVRRFARIHMREIARQAQTFSNPVMKITDPGT